MFTQTKDGMPLLRGFRLTLRQFLQAVLFAALSLGARSQEPVTPSTGSSAPAEALAAFVAKPDHSFAWRVQRRYLHDDAEVVELHLESQTWQNQLWRHQLLLVRPHRVVDKHHAIFVVGGGRWREEYETAAAETSLPEKGEIGRAHV